MLMDIAYSSSPILQLSEQFNKRKVWNTCVDFIAEHFQGKNLNVDRYNKQAFTIVPPFPI